MSANATSPKSAKRQRWPREERERFIIARATELFAERGFGLSTRELAAELGVTQALLYQYFETKQALIERVFEVTFLSRTDTDDDDLLRDASRSLEDRLVAFYEQFVRERLTPTRQRLFLRANLDGLDLAKRFSSPLDDRVLRPIVDALRAELGQPALGAKSIPVSERELAMTLHASIVFLGLRKHVYGVRDLGCLDAHVRPHVVVFLRGALDSMR